MVAVLTRDFHSNKMEIMDKTKKPFDFTRFKQRHIALKILYFGWDYDGLAEQESSNNTVEHHLFQALFKTCLVESRDKCKYNRCGRTDKGVSSHGQVVNLCVRSNLVDESEPQNLGLFTPDNYSGPSQIEAKSKELNYTNILNHVLPDHIKVIAWAPVKREFSSRFDCQSRSYSYIFPIGDLSIDLMKTASSYLVGRHDFRNLCSFDLKNGVTNHTRVIESVDIQPIRSISENEPNLDSQYTFREIIIVGQAFLYHQIRCIMTILFLVGARRESPEVVRDLLDLDKCSSRPNYNRSSSLPLCLFDCSYKPGDIPLGWVHDVTSLSNVIKQLKSLWLTYKTKTMLIERSLTNLEKVASSDGLSDHSRWRDFGLEHDTMSDSKYVPILKRPRDVSLEAKLEQLSKKRKKHPE